MAQFDDLHRCTLGTSAFQLVDFKWREQPLPRGGFVVFKVAIEGHGYVEADSPAQLTTRLKDVADSFRTPGLNFEVFGLGGASLVQLEASDLTGGGPLIGFEIMEAAQDPPLTRSFRFTLLGERIAQPRPGTEPEEDVPAERRLRTRPDGLREIAWAGTMSGKGLEARFIKLIGRFRKLYPWRRWIVQYEFTQNAAGDFAAVLITGTETVFDLPGPDEPDGLPMVRDGDGVLRWERDEQMRLTRVWEYDLLVVGDAMVVRDLLRNELVKLIGNGGVILRETLSFGLVRENRLRLSFETLAGGNGNSLLNWTQTFRVHDPWPTYEVLDFSGAEPMILRRPRGLGRIVQTGLAIGAGVWVKEPDPVLPDLLLEQPEISYTYLNETERQTTWTYVMGFLPNSEPLGGVKLAALERPAKPNATS